MKEKIEIVNMKIEDIEKLLKIMAQNGTQHYTRHV
jgi:hypothetical protein